MAAQLARVLCHFDKAKSQTFTFIIPGAIITDRYNNPDLNIATREFTYSGLKWKMVFSRVSNSAVGPGGGGVKPKNYEHFSPYLNLASTSDGLSVLTDYSFMLVNHESFSKNEYFAETSKKFCSATPAFGHRTFITVEDLPKRKFADSTGDYMLDVTLKNIRPIYRQDLVLNTPTLAQAVTGAVKTRSTNTMKDFQHYDTHSFIFGDMQWKASFCPNMEPNKHIVQLKRIGTKEYLCQLRYRISIGSGSKILRSSMFNHTFNFQGSSEENFNFNTDYLQFVQNGLMTLEIELVEITVLSELYFDLFAQPKAQTNFKDRDKQGWSLHCNCTGEKMQFRLIYSDIMNIPADYLRHIIFSLNVLPATKPNKRIQVLECPIQNFYVRQQSMDQGLTVSTEISSAEVRATNSSWLNADHKLTVQIAWSNSYLLSRLAYNFHDDIMRRQFYQAWKEVSVISRENQQLERELIKLQNSMSIRAGDETLPLVDQHKRHHLNQNQSHRIAHQKSGDSSSGIGMSSSGNPSSRSVSRDSMVYPGGHGAIPTSHSALSVNEYLVAPDGHYVGKDEHMRMENTCLAPRPQSAAPGRVNQTRKTSMPVKMNGEDYHQYADGHAPQVRKFSYIKSVLHEDVAGVSDPHQVHRTSLPEAVVNQVTHRLIADDNRRGSLGSPAHYGSNPSSPAMSRREPSPTPADGLRRQSHQRRTSSHVPVEYAYNDRQVNYVSNDRKSPLSYSGDQPMSPYGTPPPHIPRVAYEGRQPNRRYSRTVENDPGVSPLTHAGPQHEAQFQSGGSPQDGFEYYYERYTNGGPRGQVTAPTKGEYDSVPERTRRSSSKIRQYEY